MLRRPQGDGYSFARAATDSAATVRVEVQGPAEMVEAETDFLAWNSR